MYGVYCFIYSIFCLVYGCLHGIGYSRCCCLYYLTSLTFHVVYLVVGLPNCCVGCIAYGFCCFVDQLVYLLGKISHSISGRGDSATRLRCGVSDSVGS